MTEAPASDPAPLTVVIPTTRGARELEACLDALIPQARAFGGVIVIADGSGSGEQLRTDAGDVVRWIEAPGLGIFELRRLGLQAATTPLVALTEDHCVVDRDWWASVLRAHETWPEARAIAGQIVNGSTASIVERAAFLLNQHPNIPPLDPVRCLSISATSFRRDPGWTIDRVGLPLVPVSDCRGDARIRVSHVQPGGWAELAALQFHNARAIAGMDGVRTWRDMVRLAAAPVLAWFRVATAVRAWRRKGVPVPACLACAPAALVLLHAKAAGEVAGYLLGPGDSARRLQ